MPNGDPREFVFYPTLTDIINFNLYFKRPSNRCQILISTSVNAPRGWFEVQRAFRVQESAMCVKSI